MKKIYLIFCLAIISPSFAQTIGLIQHDSGTLDDGYVLFAPINSNNTYLINKCGKQVKTWNSAYKPGQSVYLLPDGSLLRTGNANNTTFNAGGKGGIIEKIDWNGNVTWSYTISDATKCQHHDVKALPNGNILVIAWELKTNTQAIASGRNPSLVASTLWSEQIFEIQPVGTNGGNIVWEWHLWDHLVQEYDNTKPNYATVANNPQLLNINYNANAANSDWIHLNSIDYNEVLDQIIISAHNINEVWIIDHSTSTAQAASHTGGNAGKGGDILYRWGNPQAYGNGSLADKKFFGQHNARWIENGFPFANQIMVYNNGNGRTGGNYTTVEIINPPLNGFNYTATLPYLPSSTSWIYNSGNPNNYYAQNISGAQPLSNGNVLMCNGPSGTFTEINSSGTTVWKYINPVNLSGVMTQGTNPTQNTVFRASFYANDFIGFAGHTLTAGNTIENTNTVSAGCSLTLATAENDSLENIVVYPNPAQESLTIQTNSFNDIMTVSLIDELGRIIQSEHIPQGNTPYIMDLSRFNNGIYFAKISSASETKTFKIIVSK